MTNALIAVLGTLLAALLTVLAGLFWNFYNARELRKQPFLARQLDLCIEASETAAVLATTVSQKDFDCAHARFLVLFWGPLSVVENSQLSKAMIQYRETLNAQISRGAPLPLRELQTESYEIARQARGLVLTAWRITNLGAEIERVVE